MKLYNYDTVSRHLAETVILHYKFGLYHLAEAVSLHDKLGSLHALLMATGNCIGAL